MHCEYYILLEVTVDIMMVTMCMELGVTEVQPSYLVPVVPRSHLDYEKKETG